MKFGLGAYLYRLPKTWADYDAQRRTFTDQTLARLQKLAANGNQNPLALTVPAGEYAGKTLGWLGKYDREYLEHVAREAQGAALRDAARKALAG